MDQEQRRTTLRAFTYGLYAVGVRDGEAVNAFTANWCTQVSFDPPLLALSVEKDSRSLPMLRAGRVFTVAVFDEGDRETAGTLGRSSTRMPDKLDKVAWFAAPNGCPVPEGALGYIECALQNEMDAGDSVLVLAEVRDAHWLRDGNPLTMRAAGFRHAG